MKSNSKNELSLEVKGTTIEKILVALLLLIPVIVFASTPLYNLSSPNLDLFGLTFYYWFATFWLFVSSMFFVVAAWLLNRMEGGGS